MGRALTGVGLNELLAAAHNFEVEMGLFNYVNFEMNCPGCGSLLRDFQTKNGHCCLDIVEIETVTAFYALCGNCNHWTEFTRIPPPPELRERKERATREQAEALGFRLVSG